ncbi:MAG TPA: sigma-70 family RNA polymerase sigma factor [Anaeromyxobacteraceae bacterium]|nr:sigma-70 family RNA polymerase sigma factor [Anaeromyxobacteraceae bacterium]
MPVELEECYRRYGPMVLRRCRRLLREEERALDAMHDVFVELLRRDGLFTPPHPRPAALLMRIATNVCLNRLRTARRHPEDRDDGLLLRIASTDGGAEGYVAARQLLERIFRRERPSTRDIAVMHLVDGMTLEEVAREVNLSVSGVRKRLRVLRARVAGLEGA